MLRAGRAGPGREGVPTGHLQPIEQVLGRLVTPGDRQRLRGGRSGHADPGEVRARQGVEQRGLTRSRGPGQGDDGRRAGEGEPPVDLAGHPLRLGDRLVPAPGPGTSSAASASARTRSASPAVSSGRDSPPEDRHQRNPPGSSVSSTSSASTISRIVGAQQVADVVRDLPHPRRLERRLASSPSSARPLQRRGRCGRGRCRRRRTGRRQLALDLVDRGPKPSGQLPDRRPPRPAAGGSAAARPTSARPPGRPARPWRWSPAGVRPGRRRRPPAPAGRSRSCRPRSRPRPR